MKQLTFAFLSIVFLAFTSCGGSSESNDGQQDSTEVSQSSDVSGMTSLDLSPHGMDLTIMIPDESFGKPMITENAMGGVDINVGENFGISVLFGMGDVMLMKSDLENDLVYDHNIILDKEDLLMYEKSIPESGIDPEFHFYYTTLLNGETYDVQNMTDRSFSKAAIERMIISAETLKGKTAS